MDKQIREALKNYVAEKYEGYDGLYSIGEIINLFLCNELNLGRLLSDCADYCSKDFDSKRAIEYLKAALLIEPERHMLLTDIAKLYWQFGKKKKTFHYLNKAIEKAPDCIDTLLVKSTVLLEMERYDEAIDACNTAIASKPNYSEAYLNKAKIFMATAKYDEALENSLKALELDKFNKEIPELIAEIYYVHFQNEACALEYLAIAENTTALPF